MLRSHRIKGAKGRNPTMLYDLGVNDNLNFIDLFAGAGGLSEGFIRAGFNPIAHVEMNEDASKTLETRLAYHYLRMLGNLKPYYDYEKGKISRQEFLEVIPDEVKESVINETMSEMTLPLIFRKIDNMLNVDGQRKHVHLIVGGPPCQAYSLVGRARILKKENKERESDSRKTLYLLYARFLQHFNPDMFVFENVLGLNTVKDINGNLIYPQLKQSLEDGGYIVVKREQDAENFGVPQKRKRLIIIGWRNNTNHFYPDFPVTKNESLVKKILADLPIVSRGDSENKYRLPLCKSCSYVKDNQIREHREVLTLHEARKNSDKDVEIYKKVIRAWNKGERLRYDKLPKRLKSHKNQNGFLDRFKVVEGKWTACHTILAHLAKDGHYFIHPDIKQCRSITPREAARLQSFPDNYYFEGSRTSRFMQIGNAVPPMMAEIIANSIRNQFLL